MSLLSDRTHKPKGEGETTAEELKSRRLFQNVVDISYLPQLLRANHVSMYMQMEDLYRRYGFDQGKKLEDVYAELSWWRTHRESQDKLLLAAFIKRAVRLNQIRR